MYFASRSLPFQLGITTVARGDCGGLRAAEQRSRASREELDSDQGAGS